MTLSLMTSMALFAFAASFSPGPVNLVSVSNGARYGLGKGLSFITGATLGFILLFFVIGFGLHHVLAALPLKQFLQEAVVPYEHDEVTRLIIDGHDTRSFSKSLEDEIVRDADKLWRFDITGISVACDWFKMTPTQYANRLEKDVIPQLHLPESIAMAQVDLVRSKRILQAGAI